MYCSVAEAGQNSRCKRVLGRLTCAQLRSDTYQSKYLQYLTSCLPCPAFRPSPVRKLPETLMKQSGQYVSAEFGTYNDVGGNQQIYYQNVTIREPTSPKGNDSSIQSGIYDIINEYYNYSLSDSADEVVRSSSSGVAASVFYAYNPQLAF
jgi:hypothetical protein